VLCGLIAAAAVLVPVAPANAAPIAYVMYEANGNVNLGTVDLGAGGPAVTFVGDTGRDVGTSFIAGIALAPSGQLVAIDSEADELLTLNPSTGAVIDSVALSLDVENASPAVTSDGRVLMAYGGDLWEIEPDTGEATSLVGDFVSVNSVATRCVDAAGTNEAFVWSSFETRLYHVDLATLVATPLPNPVGVPVNSSRIAFDTEGTLWALNYAVVTPQVFTIDTTTGVGTTVGNVSTKNFLGLAITPTTCPAAPQPPVDPPIDPPVETPAPAVAAAVPLAPTFTG
jgi:hypothetical protein